MNQLKSQNKLIKFKSKQKDKYNKSKQNNVKQIKSKEIMEHAKYAVLKINLYKIF